MRDATPELNLLALLPSWELHLRAERKAAATVRSYRQGVRAFVRWCEANARPQILDRPTVNAWTAAQLDDGDEPAGVRLRQLAVRRMSAWLVDEDEIPRDELFGVKPPKLDEKLVERLTDDECRALLKTCSGGRDFLSRRDEAIIRLLLDGIMRAGELIGMTTDDVNPTHGTATIHHAKGGKGRIVPFGPQTSRALDRYLRVRRAHRLADSPALWLGGKGQRFGYSGLYRTLSLRARAAGIEHFHPHLTRHTSAQRWLDAKGSEGGLMAVAGWSRREMLDRYTRATAQQRAVAEARGLNLGDW